MSINDDIILTVRQAAAALGLCRATFYREEKRGTNPAFPRKIQLSRGRVGYSARACENYLLAQQQPGALLGGRGGFVSREAKAA